MREADIPFKKRSILGFELKDEHVFLTDRELESRVDDLNHHEMARLVDLWLEEHRKWTRGRRRWMRRLPGFREQHGLPHALPGDKILPKLGRPPKRRDLANNPVRFVSVLHRYLSEVWPTLKRGKLKDEILERFVRRIAAGAEEHRLRPSRQKLKTLFMRKLPPSRGTTPLSLALDAVATMTTASRASLRRDCYRRLDRRETTIRATSAS